MVRHVNSQQSFMRSERRMDNEMTVTTFYEGRNKRAKKSPPECRDCTVHCVGLLTCRSHGARIQHNLRFYKHVASTALTLFVGGESCAKYEVIGIIGTPAIY